MDTVAATTTMLGTHILAAVVTSIGDGGVDDELAGMKVAMTPIPMFI